MNKKVITAGAASLVLAAMPIVGTFADQDLTTVTDNITLTVTDSCTLGAQTADGTSMNAVTHEFIGKGSIDNLTGSKFDIVCNGQNGWKLDAVGAGTGGGAVTDLYNTEASHAIPSAGSITIDEEHSNWGFKLSSEDSLSSTIESGYNGTEPAFAAIPATATTVAQTDTPLVAGSIQVTYGISDDGDAPEGTYTGAVKYTLTEKAGV